MKEMPEDTRLLTRLVGQNELEIDLQSLASDNGFHFVKTHDLPGTDSSPAIVLVRDGRDAVVSYAHFLLKTEKGIENPTAADFEQALEHVIRSQEYGGWSQNVNAWADRVGDDNIIRYEDLISNPIDVSTGILHRFSLNGGPLFGTAPSFQELHVSIPWFFRRGVPGGWKDEMPGRLQDLFWTRSGDAMERFGYLRLPRFSHT
jgi:Sulfotransferase domain